MSCYPNHTDCLSHNGYIRTECGYGWPSWVAKANGQGWQLVIAFCPTLCIIGVPLESKNLSCYPNHTTACWVRHHKTKWLTSCIQLRRIIIIWHFSQTGLTDNAVLLFVPFVLWPHCGAPRTMVKGGSSWPFLSRSICICWSPVDIDIISFIGHFSCYPDHTDCWAPHKQTWFILWHSAQRIVYLEQTGILHLATRFMRRCWRLLTIIYTQSGSLLEITV